MSKKAYLQAMCDNQGRLLGFIKSLHCNKAEVEDILQDTNITLLNKQKDFDSSKKFLPWAFTIARFTWMAHKKKRARENKKFLYNSDTMDILLDTSPLELKDQLAYEIEVERLELLDQIKPSLSAKQKDLLESLLEGESTRDIASKWGVKYGAVQTLKVRTIRRIKDIVLRIKYQERNNEKRKIQKTTQTFQEEEGRYFKPA